MPFSVICFLAPILHIVLSFATPEAAPSWTRGWVKRNCDGVERRRIKRVWYTTPQAFAPAINVRKMPLGASRTRSPECNPRQRPLSQRTCLQIPVSFTILQLWTGGSIPIKTKKGYHSRNESKVEKNRKNVRKREKKKKKKNFNRQDLQIRTLPHATPSPPNEVCLFSYVLPSSCFSLCKSIRKISSDFALAFCCCIWSKGSSFQLKLFQTNSKMGWSIPNNPPPVILTILIQSNNSKLFPIICTSYDISYHTSF